MVKALASRRSGAVLAMAMFAFVLSAVPKLNVRVGPIPLYLIDLLILLLLYYAIRRPGFEHRSRPFAGIVIALLLFALVGETVGLVYTGSVFDHAYLMFRTFLAFSVFFIVGQMVRSMQDLEVVLKALTLGLIVTASMMILTSLPMTRAFVSSTILNNNFLDPAGTQVASSYLSRTEGGIRGRTLVGVSILGASFINMVWPLVACLLVWPNISRNWSRLAMIACMLAPLGVLMSYSRGPIIGSLLIVIMTLLFALNGIRKGIVVPICVGTMFVLAVGVNSEVFFFDRLVNRTTAALENPFTDERESERILAYVEPFEHVVDHPQFLFFGQGNAINRSNAVVAEIKGKASHALFAVAYYSQGMLAALTYAFLFASMFFYTMRHMKFRQEGPAKYLSQALFASALGILPWAVFGHAIVSAPRGTMMFFFILGLMTSLRHLPFTQPEIPQNRSNHVHSRHLVV